MPPERFEPTRVPELAASRARSHRAARSASILWATGFRPDYSWLDVPVLDRKGRLRHDGGVVGVAGPVCPRASVPAPAQVELHPRRRGRRARSRRPPRRLSRWRGSTRGRVTAGDGRTQARATGLSRHRPGVAAPQLPALLLRPGHLAHRHLADADRDQLAGLPADRLGAAARRGRLRRPDPDLRAGAVRRRVGRPLEPPPRAGGHAGARHGAVGAARRASRCAAPSPCTTSSRSASSRASSTPFDMPARQAFVVQMVETRADLPNAIALNSSMVNAARLLGPSIGGILIAAVGEGWCFPIDAASYLAVIASLLAMRAIPRRPAPRSDPARVARSCAEGFRYVVGFRPIAAMLGLLALVSLMGMPYTVLMPIIAGQVLHGGPHTLGLLMAAAGLGALVRRALSGVAPDGGGPRARHRRSRGRLRSRPGRVLVLARALALAAAGAAGRSLHDAADGGQQHRHPDDGRRGQARPRDELLRDGLLRHRADREPASPARSPTASARRTPSWPAASPASSAGAVFLRGAAAPARGGAADLRSAWASCPRSRKAAAAD